MAHEQTDISYGRLYKVILRECLSAVTSLCLLLPPEKSHFQMETNSTGAFFDDLIDWPSAYEVYQKVETSDTILFIRQNAHLLLPIFCMVGIIGNSMALMLIRTNFWLKRLTSNIYLCTLSISSCLFLCTLLVTWADSLYHISLYRHNEIGCKAFTFVAHFSDFICVWQIALISIDRMIVLYRPGIRKWVCTKKFAFCTMLGICVTSAVLYSPVCLLFAGEEFQLTPSGDVIGFCGLSNNATLFGYPVSQYYFIFLSMDTVVCTVLPSIVIIVVNTFSTYRYRQYMKSYMNCRVRFSNNNHIQNEGEKVTVRYLEPRNETSAKRLLLSPSQTKQNPTTTTVSQTGGSGGHLLTQSRCGKLRSSDLQLSRTLLIVTSTFVLLNVPNYVMRIVQYLFVWETQLFHLIHYVSYLMYYFHHAVLFYMYIFWSPQMKKQLKPTAVRLLECYCFKSVPEFGHHSLSGGR